MTDVFLRDTRNPVAHSDRDIMKVSKTMLLGLKSTEQKDEYKQPYVNA